MKKVILILLFLNISSVFSQTGYFNQLLFNYKGDSVNLSTHPDFHRNRFTLGWHWASGKTMTKALKMNQIHHTIDKDADNPTYRTLPPEFNRAADSSLLMSQSTRLYWSWQKYSPIFSTAMHFEPTLQISENTTENYLSRSNDKFKPIFGFENIKGYIYPNSISIADMSKLFLYRDSLHSGDTVLSKPWKGNELRHNGKINIDGSTTINYYLDPFYTGNNDSLFIRETNNSEIYLSINLSRINSLDTLLNNDVVLSIKLPFVNLRPSSGEPIRGYINFDSLPSPTPGDIINLPDSRGIARTLVEGSGNVFNITRNMLPKGNAAPRDITLSAHIRFDGEYGDGKVSKQ